MEELYNDIALLKKEAESNKMSINMLTTLIQSHQMLLNNLTNKSMLKPVVEKPVVEKPVIEKPVVKKSLMVTDYNQLALEWVSNEANIKGFTIETFFNKCKYAITKLPLQNTNDNLEDVLCDIAKNVYEQLPLKDKPFFGFGKRDNRKIIYKNKYNEWLFGLDEIVKQVYFLERNMRIHQLDQITNKEIDDMSSHEQELWVEYSQWTTSEVNKSRIAKNLLEFITILEL